jgi:hypothetical protein
VRGRGDPAVGREEVERPAGGHGFRLRLSGEPPAARPGGGSLAGLLRRTRSRGE